MNEIYDDDSERDGNDVTTQDCLEYAKQFLKMFFRNRVDEYGCEIEIEDLLTERNVSLVANMTVCDGMPIIYDVLNTTKKENTTKEKHKGKLPEDVEMILKLLNEIAKMSAPKNFAAGLIAIYVEVCKGCKLDDNREFRNWLASLET